jgi:hypothetical protein
MSVDDKASELEQMHRDAALSVRKPAGPQPCGVCHNCDDRVCEGMRFCDADCRDDWSKRNDAA